jgi:hypothetical protein
MTQRSDNAQTTPIVSDERIRNALRRQIDIAINVKRDFTRQQLSDESGVNIFCIDQITSDDVAKHRRIKIADAFSLAAVIGPSAVNALIAVMGYDGARRTSDRPNPDYSHIICDGLRDFSVIAAALADGRIDHTEERPTTEAADHLIATVMPLSSAGRVA